MKKLLKSLFSFSKTESNGAFILFILIALCLSAPSGYKLIFGKKYNSFSEDQELLNSLVEKMEIAIHKKEKVGVEMTSFNPNTASITELIQLGIPPFISRRIDNYRKGGGRFIVKTDLSKIYDFPDSLYQILSPYIDLPDVPVNERTSKNLEKGSITSNSRARIIESQSKYNEPPLLVDINTADTAEFKKLYGVGSGYAKRLVSFREALGGYYEVDQIRDMYGMTDSLFLQIKSFLHISDKVTIKTININIATFQQLNAHPYISYELTKEILAAKSKYGKFKTPDDLKRLNLLDSIDRIKLLPYLNF